MRPSDVPTYVEAGAADIGITGKDVLLEQADRVVYELLDLGFGRCRMVLAGRRGDERLGESERRLGMMRIATKYPRIAERHFERTGHQVEVIEVKGSVELAPLIGFAFGKPNFNDLVLNLSCRTVNGKQTCKGVIAYGRFLSDSVNFVIIGFSVFIIIKTFERLQRLRRGGPPQEEGEPLTVDQELLAEIRDLLRERSS